MKTLVQKLPLVALLLFCSSLTAQEYVVGVKGGFSIPNLSAGGQQNPINSGYSSRFGPDFGVFVAYPLTQRFSISLGAEFSSQGGKKNKFQAYATPPELQSIVPGPYLYANFKSEAKLNYVLIPLLLRAGWYLGQSDVNKFYVSVGPFAGFLVSAHQVTSGSSIVYMDEAMTMPLAPGAQPFDANTNIKNELYTFNLGIDGFVGISHNFGQSHTLFLEIGGNYGFLSIQKQKGNGKNYTGAGVATIGYAHTF